MIAALLLTLGLLLAPFGTFVYVVVALADPDYETLRISKTAAIVGRWTVAAGAGSYLIDTVRAGASVSALMAVVLMLAAAVVVASQLTRLSPPRHPRPV
jgi:hypothetical protein